MKRLHFIPWLIVLVSLLVVGAIAVFTTYWQVGAAYPAAVWWLSATLLAALHVWLLTGSLAWGKARWQYWMPVYLVLVLLTGGLAAGAWWLGGVWSGVCIIALGGLLGMALIYRAIPDHRGARQTSVLIVSLSFVAVLVTLLHAEKFSGAAVALAGACVMSVGLFLGLKLIRLIVSAGHPVCAVARTLVDEAMRIKIAMIFILLAVILVAALPLALDPTELLKYRLEFFLTWSLGCTLGLLGLMTVFLCCRTVSSDLAQRQIYLTATKPISRGQYLLGKWLGVMLLNALLLAVTGVGIYTYARLLQTQRAVDASDRAAVNHEILTARRSILPSAPPGVDLNALVRQRFLQLHRQDPDRWGGQFDASDPDQVAKAMAQLSPADLHELRTQVVVAWHTIPPLGVTGYLFTGLQEAPHYADRLQLRFKPNASQSPPNGMDDLAFIINGRPWPIDPTTHRPIPIRVSDKDYHVMAVPTSLIDAQGDLLVQIANVNAVNPRATFNTSITFEPNGGLEVLYEVGTFEANLVRALLIMLAQLALVAMISLAAGALLSFPVAVLLALMLFVAAMASGFLTGAISQYTIGNGQMTAGEAILTMVIRMVGRGFVAVVPPLGDYTPVSLVSSGRVVSMALLSGAWLWLGVVYTGAVGVLGWLIFRSRELARVTV